MDLEKGKKKKKDDYKMREVFQKSSKKKRMTM